MGQMIKEVGDAFMNLKEKREAEKLKRRQLRMDEILEAAEALFVDKGIKESKMTDIAKKCELSKGSLYFYFTSKDDIVWELLKKHSLSEYKAGKDYIDSLECTGYEKLEKYFELFSKELINTYSASTLSFQYREHMLAMISNGVMSDEVKMEFESLYKRNLSMIPSLILLGQEDGSIKTEIEAELIGNGIGIAFGAYFRNVVGLKASFEKAFIDQRLKEFQAYNLLILATLKK